MNALASPGFASHRSHGLVAGLTEIFGPDLLAVWPLYGPQLVTDASVIASPDDFSAEPPWTRLECSFSDAATMRETVVNAQHRIGNTLSVSVGPRAISVDVEPDGREWARVVLDTGYAYFHLSGAGSVGTQANATGLISLISGSRYRCTLSDFTSLIASPVFYVNTATGDGTVSYAGDITKGLKLYNAQVNQTSIVTAPNICNPGTYDLTNATKASQPVLTDTAWGGVLEGAVFAGANYLTADGIAAAFSGTDKPLCSVDAFQPSAVTANTRLWGFGRAASALSYFENANYSKVAGTLRSFYRGQDAGGTVDSGNGYASTLNRTISAASYTGTAITSLVNGVAEYTAAACDATDVTLDRFTYGAMRRNGAPANHFAGTARLAFLASVAPTAAQLAAASRLVEDHCPIA